MDLRYPIGKFDPKSALDLQDIRSGIAIIEMFPEQISTAAQNLDDDQLNTPYRPGGWTLRQVVHHCADSHMNSLIRFKLALTEDKPVIKPYFEDRWADLPDSLQMEIHSSLLLISSLHKRWVFLLRHLAEKDFQKVYLHPESGNQYRLDTAIDLYAWHCRHHLAHITELKSRKGWP